MCGPFKIRSTGGARYFTTFIDDFSKKTWIYFIAQKSQVLEKFQHFVRLVENLTGQTVRALRTDNGGEYTSKAFQEYTSLTLPGVFYMTNNFQGTFGEKLSRLRETF